MRLTPLFNAVKKTTQTWQNREVYRIPPATRAKSEQLQKLQHPEKLKAAILDWSGTTLDAHVLAPAVIFEDVFKKHGVPITNEEARAPMGLRKDLHISAILAMPQVQARWLDIKKRQSTQQDIDALFADFVPMQIAVLKKYSTLLPGTVEAIDELRRLGLKIGCTTGFTKAMVDELLAAAKTQGYVPDSSVAGDQVKNGARPTPHMLYRNMDNVGVHVPGAVLKVDDTVTGVGEGLSAGTWTAGIYGYSNYTGIESLEQLAAMPTAELEERQEHSRAILHQSGAHYLIKSPSQLPTVVHDINRRLQNGETPTSNKVFKKRVCQPS